MTSKRQPYKTYTREFKVEAVRLMHESDRPSSEVAAELGIRRKGGKGSVTNDSERGKERGKGVGDK